MTHLQDRPAWKGCEVPARPGTPGRHHLLACCVVPQLRRLLAPAQSQPSQLCDLTVGHFTGVMLPPTSPPPSEESCALWSRSKCNDCQKRSVCPATPLTWCGSTDVAETRHHWQQAVTPPNLPPPAGGGAWRRLVSEPAAAAAPPQLHRRWQKSIFSPWTIRHALLGRYCTYCNGL